MHLCLASCFLVISWFVQAQEGQDRNYLSQHILFSDIKLLLATLYLWSTKAELIKICL